MSTYVKECPNCGKLFKYMDSITPFCDVCKGYKMLVEIPTTDDVIETMRSLTKYCPKCGDFFSYEKSKKDFCDFCGTKLIESDFTNEQLWYMTSDKICEWRKQHIMTNPLFDEDVYERMKSQNLLKLQIQQASSTPRCPHCGSTSFQMVPRRWSLGMGFLTNKVDRVCTQCKTKF